MSKPTIIRSLFGVGLWAAVAAMAAIAVVSVLLAPQAMGKLGQVLPLPILVVGLGWVLLVAPKLALHDDRIVVDNPFQRVEVPSERVVGLETTKGFALKTDDGRRVHAWAAPPPDRLQGMRNLGGGHGDGGAIARDPRVLREDGDRVRSSAMPGTLSGDAAMAARHHGAGAEAPAEGARPIVRTPRLASIAVAILTMAAAGGSLLLG